MRIYTITYFAILREQSGKSQESFQSKSSDLVQLYEELRAMYKFSLDSKFIRPVVNQVFCTWDIKLEEGDRICFIPPVAGG